MHFESHAALGWLIGNLGTDDRPLRNYCVLGAILPDVDAISLLCGIEAYSKYHHTFGHNLFFALWYVAFVTWRVKTFRAFVLSSIAIASHLATDACLSGWEIYLFWPFSEKGYLLANIGLGSSINRGLVFGSFVLIVFLAFTHRRTPVDLFSPELDRHLVSFFMPRKQICHECGRPCNQYCSLCHNPVCWIHGTIGKKFALYCQKCKP